MSEYIPTTEEVRLTYAISHDDHESYAEFDRWLARHDAKLLRRHADFIREGVEAGEWTRASSAAIYLYEEADAITEGSK